MWVVSCRDYVNIWPQEQAIYTKPGGASEPACLTTLGFLMVVIADNKLRRVSLPYL